VIMTSNLGTEMARDGRFDRDELMALLRRHFRPEFLNRIDEIVVFEPLTKAEIRKIVDLQLNRLKQQLTEEGIEVIIEPGVEDMLAQEGYDPEFGARPLKRVIQSRIENQLARLILEKRPQKVRIKVIENEIVLMPE
ncbi:MAG: type VI secretion system ATPase TssH, partial [candidate division WOR-3 bacterium]